MKRAAQRKKLFTHFNVVNLTHAGSISMPMVPDSTINDLAQMGDVTASPQQRAGDFVAEQSVLALTLSFFAGILLGKHVL